MTPRLVHAALASALLLAAAGLTACAPAAELPDSVPLEVMTSSLGGTPRRLASSLRASSMACRTS